LQLRETYMAVRMHERQKLENKFEALFRRYDDVTIDVTRVAEALRRER